jgi:serine/threonine-protein kinase
MSPKRNGKAPASKTTRCGQLLQARYSYRLEEPLGRGAFGTVFRASVESEDGILPLGVPQTVAVKVSRPTSEQEGLLVAKRELAALQVLDDARIPRLHDWSLQPNAMFIVTDYYRNGSLRAAMNGQPPSEPTIWRLLTDLLRAVSIAHRRAILHLDIKPENVLLDDGGGFVLTDFGISQATLASEGAAHQAAVGTPGYQSPEQFLMDLGQLDTQSDLFGIGATVWAFASGVNLSSRKSLLKYGVGRSVLPPLRRYRPQLSGDLEACLEALTRENPEERPGGAAEVLRHIRSLGGTVNETYEVVSLEEADLVRKALMDPMWARMVDRGDLLDRLVRFEQGTVLCREGDESYEAFLLLKGTLRIEFEGRKISELTREGTLIGEIATLTGTHRTATVICASTVHACVFNAADLERFLTRNPPAALRILKDVSERIIRERELFHQQRRRR